MSATQLYRPRGIKWLIIGAVLTVVGAAVTYYGAHYLADSDVEMSRALELLMALPALLWPLLQKLPYGIQLDEAVRAPE